MQIIKEKNGAYIKSSVQSGNYGYIFSISFLHLSEYRLDIHLYFIIWVTFAWTWGIIVQTFQVYFCTIFVDLAELIINTLRNQVSHSLYPNDLVNTSQLIKISLNQSCFLYLEWMKAFIKCRKWKMAPAAKKLCSTVPTQRHWMQNGTIDTLNNNDDRDYETTRYITFTNNPIEIKYPPHCTVTYIME